MIRWLEDHTERGEVWGVDISGAHITWCQQNLSSPFRFATTTTFPHLPFEDNYFDLIYAASVFTHISDLAEAWLMELRRIARPGGRLVRTVDDKHTLELVFDPEWASAHPDANPPGYVQDYTRAILSSPESREILEQDFAVATIGRGPVSQVFHDASYLCQHWGSYLKVHSITPEPMGIRRRCCWRSRRRNPRHESIYISLLVWNAKATTLGWRFYFGSFTRPPRPACRHRHSLRDVESAYEPPASIKVFDPRCGVRPGTVSLRAGNRHFSPWKSRECGNLFSSRLNGICTTRGAPFRW
jgi:SAM-dependent methyltransferase